MSSTNDPSRAPSPRVIAPSFISFDPQGLVILKDGETPPAIHVELSPSTSLPIIVQWQTRKDGNDTWENYLDAMSMNSISALNLLGSESVTKEYRVMVTNAAGSTISPAVKFLYN